MANTLRIKRRAAGGQSGGPSSMANAELAFNESDNILYYGFGTGGTGGSATQADPIGGSGAFTTLTTDQTISGDKTFTGTVDFSGATISGDSTFSNDLTVTGNLTVNGTTTTVNSTTVSVDDKNLELGSLASTTIATADVNGAINNSDTVTLDNPSATITTGLVVTGTGISGFVTVSSITSQTASAVTLVLSSEQSIGDNVELTFTSQPTDTTADGGGLTLKGATDKTFNWVDSTNSWTSSEDLDLSSGKHFSIAGTTVLDGSSLGTGITGSSLTSVGTISTGTWQGTAIKETYIDITNSPTAGAILTSATDTTQFTWVTEIDGGSF